MVHLGPLDDALFRWATLIGGQATIVAGLYWNRTSAANRAAEAKQTAEAAKVAAEKTAKAVAPVSNGFATDMREGLRELKELVKEVNAKVDSHIGAHAAADVRRGRQ